MKISSKTAKKTVKNSELTEMFNQMLGLGAINMQIVFPKYRAIMEACTTIIRVFKKFNEDSPIYDMLPDMVKYRSKIKDFVETATVELKLFTVDYPNPYQLSEEQKKQFSELYNTIKKSKLIESLIRTCNNLAVYHDSLTGSNTNDEFIVRMADSFKPFAFVDLDIREFVVDLRYRYKDNSRYRTSCSNLLMIVMSKIYNLTYTIYQQVTLPDIDVDVFVNILMDNLGEIKKQIPRCNKAFNKLVSSVQLLKTNFNGYFADFVRSNDPSIFMQNFIIDVSTSTDIDAETTRQFRQIMMFYKSKLPAKLATNPQAKFLFDQMAKQLDKLDEYTNIKDPKDASSAANPIDVAGNSLPTNDPINVVSADESSSDTLTEGGDGNSSNGSNGKSEVIGGDSTASVITDSGDIDRLINTIEGAINAKSSETSDDHYQHTCDDPNCDECFEDESDGDDDLSVHTSDENNTDAGESENEENNERIRALEQALFGIEEIAAVSVTPASRTPAKTPEQLLAEAQEQVEKAERQVAEAKEKAELAELVRIQTLNAAKTVDELAAELGDIFGETTRGKGRKGKK
jgi:hypothetical protein